MGMLIVNHDAMIDTKKIKYIFVEYKDQLDIFKIVCDIGNCDLITLFGCKSSDIDIDMIYGEQKRMQDECPNSKCTYSPIDAGSSILTRKMSEIWAEMDKHGLSERKYIPNNFKDFIKC